MFRVTDEPNIVYKKNKVLSLRAISGLTTKLIFLLMMICFWGMVDRREEFNIISIRDHFQRSSPLQISNPPLAGFETVQNLSSGFVEPSCAVLITTTPQCNFLLFPPLEHYICYVSLCNT